jgi:predicted nucleotide-binding protein
MNLRAFIGSSSESMNVANAIEHALDSDGIECRVWTGGFFELSHFILETLIAGVDDFDVGIFSLWRGRHDLQPRSGLHRCAR